MEFHFRKSFSKIAIFGSQALIFAGWFGFGPMLDRSPPGDFDLKAIVSLRA